jgi:hypothetical protein
MPYILSTMIQITMKPKVEVKAEDDNKLSLESVFYRLNLIGHDRFDIQLEPELLDTTVTRDFMSKNFGGNTERTFPTIGKQWTHGINNFMFANPNYNPHAPRNPGDPGLYYTSRSRDHAHHDGPVWHKLQIVFFRVGANRWSYCGLYKFTTAPPLTKEEWLQQSEKVSRYTMLW